jgi:hypothetical protein
MVHSRVNRCSPLGRSATMLSTLASGATAGRCGGAPDGSHRGSDRHDPPGQAGGVRQALRRGPATGPAPVRPGGARPVISLDDDQTFVWLRRFDSQQERQRKWDEFYGSDLWRNQLGPRANPLMQDTSNVIAVQPTPGSAIQ